MFLVERDGYTPVKSAVIVYNDLIPREIAADPIRIPEFVTNVKTLLGSNLLPRSIQRCQYCAYGPLSAILPDDGGVTVDDILHLKYGMRPKRGVVTSSRFESKSKPGTNYTVTRSSKGELSCNCPGWTFRKKCWHIEKSSY